MYPVKHGLISTLFFSCSFVLSQSVLKLRDQKQLDFEELSDFLQQQVAERDRLKSNGRLGGTGTIGGFFQQKMDEIKGVDQERAKQDKLKRVAERIQEVKKQKKLFCPRRNSTTLRVRISLQWRGVGNSL